MKRSRIIRSLAAVLVVSSQVVTPSAMASVNTGGCDVSVARMQDAARDARIAGAVAVAQQNSTRRPEKFSSMSCLERLMNSGGDIFFSPPNLGALISSLEGFVCNKANGVFRDVTSPLNQTFGERVRVGDIIPGVNVGSIGGGVNVRVRTGQSGPGTVTTNLNQALGKVTGNPVSSSRTQKSLGELFR